MAEKQTAMMKLNVKVKAGHAGDYHRFILSGSPGPSFEDLRRRVAGIAQATFGVPDGPEVDYKITYQDDEDDPCVLTNQEDLDTAISFLLDPAAPLRLTVQHVSPATAPAPNRQHGPRWHAVRGEQGWHAWAVDKFGPMPARRLAAAWSISPGAAVKKIIAAMEGSPEALKAIETALCRDVSAGQDEQPADGKQPPPPPRGHEGPWHPHEAHPWMHHMMMMKGKGCLKGKGLKGMMMKGKGWHHPEWVWGQHHHGPEPHAEWHHKGKGMGKKGKGGHDGGHCRGRGGPANKIAQALGVDKHEAWRLIEAAAGGDAAAQEKLSAIPDAEQADAFWLEAKLAKKAEKMACKSELLEAKAAWFASSDKKKHQVKAAKLQQKAAAVQSKGEHLHKLAAGFQAQETVQTDAKSVAPPAPVENTVSQGGVTDFVETFTIVEPNVDQDEAEANGQSDGLLEEVLSVPLEWADALQSMTTMGFDPAQATQALQAHNGNLQLAVAHLIGGVPHQ